MVSDGELLEKAFEAARQFVSGEMDFKTLITREGTTDVMVFRSIFVNKELDLPFEINPKFIIDAGAYTGLSTLYFSHKYPKAKIIAIEPEESNFETLKTNSNQFQNIKPINSALWSKESYLKIIDNRLGNWAFSVKEVGKNSEYDLSGITINDILNETSFNTIDILKLDIEGAEKEIFTNNHHLWLDKVQVIIIELHDRYIEGCTDAVYSAIDLDYWDEYKKGEKVIFRRK